MSKTRKVRIVFPQIVIDSKHVEVSEEQLTDLLENSDSEERGDFIWKHMTEHEQQHTYGKAWTKEHLQDTLSGRDIVEIPADDGKRCKCDTLHFFDHMDTIDSKGNCTRCKLKR